MSKKYEGVCEGHSNPPEVRTLLLIALRPRVFNRRAQFLPQLLQLMKDGKFPIEKISKQYSFADFDQALKDMKTGEVIKPILVM